MGKPFSGPNPSLMRRSSFAEALSWTFPAGRVSGIPLRIHWTLPLFCLFELSGARWLSIEATALGLMFLSILVHELGHCWEARRLGLGVDRILLWPLGGLAYVGHGRTPKDDLRVALAGPLTHLPWILACALAIQFLGPGLKPEELSPFGAPVIDPDLWGLAVTQVTLKWQVQLLCLNLLIPAYPLDCGRIVVASLLLRGWSRERAAQAIIGLSVVAAVVVMTQGVLFIGLIVFLEAFQLAALLQARQLDQHGLFRHTPSTSYRPVTPLRPVPRGKKCPFCARRLPSSARMCGFCEKIVP